MFKRNLALSLINKIYVSVVNSTLWLIWCIYGINKRTILVYCFSGKSFTCNPKYICEAINSRYPEKFKIIFLSNNENIHIPEYVQRIKYGSPLAIFYRATAKIIIDNCRGKRMFRKNPGQLYFQTWHAYLGPKKCEADVEKKLGINYVINARDDGKLTDFMIANNEFEANIYKKSFWYTGPVFRCGIPRNQPLIKHTLEHRNKLLSTLKIDEKVGICLYAPTFRNNGGIETYNIDVDRILKALELRFGREFIFCYRMHPNVQNLELQNSNAINLSKYEDSQELLAAVDILISDYSSIMEDFILTERPGFMYVSDISDYNIERGFYYDLKMRPFKVCTTNDELVEAILKFDEFEHKKSHDEFVKYFKIEDDGNGAYVVADLIYNLTYNNKTIDDYKKKFKIF